MVVKPAKMAAMVLLGALLALYVLLSSGCASASWNAKVVGEPDFKAGPEFMPKFEAGIGGTF